MEMKTALQKAIGTAFNTHEMIKMFGAQDDDLGQILQLEESFRLKKIDKNTFNQSKLKILQRLKEKGGQLSEENISFLKDRENELYNCLEEVQ